MVECGICGRPGRIRGEARLCDECCRVCSIILKAALKGATREQILEILRREVSSEDAQV